MAEEKYKVLEQLLPLLVPIGDLSLDATNARLHPEKNLSSIAGSLAQFGQRKPLVVQKKGMVVRAGNGTLTAAKDLGWTHVAAVVVDEDNVTAVGFAIADNRTGELARWDPDVLGTLLGELDPDLVTTIGFDSDDLGSILSSWTTPDKPEDFEGYVEEEDTFTVKIDNVTPEHRDEIVRRCNDAVQDLGYKATSY